MIRKLEWVLQINLRFPVISVTGKETYTSKQCTRSNKKQGRNVFEISVRAVAAFREIGRGLEAINSFSPCMNMNSVSDCI